MPGVPGVVERRDLEEVCKTYGKTIHFWQVDRGDALPLGVPQIMMALTREGQLRQDLADCTSVGMHARTCRARRRSYICSLVSFF
jgi:hypothetical protein